MHPQEPWCRLEIEPRKETTGGGDVAELWKTNFLRQKLTGGAFATFWTSLIFTQTFFAIDQIFIGFACSSFEPIFAEEQGGQGREAHSQCFEGGGETFCSV